MKTREALQPLIDQIRSPDSPVGMDATYVHALILDKLIAIEDRLARLEQQAAIRTPRTAETPLNEPRREEPLDEPPVKGQAAKGPRTVDF